MLPYIFFPMLGIASSGDIAAKYFNNTNFLLFGGLLVASAIEFTGLHKRVALSILSKIGTGLRSLLFGFMLVTWVCSMFMSNTATTAMVIPILLSVLDEITLDGTVMANKNTKDESDFTTNEIKPMMRMSLIRKGMILAIPYSASIGGIATVNGSPTNLVLQEYYTERFPNDEKIDLNYAQWLGFGIFNSTLMIVIIYFYMLVYYFGICYTSDKKNDDLVSAAIKTKLSELPKFNRAEGLVVVAMITLIMAWIFANPGFITGWTSWFPEPSFIKDGVPAMLIGIVLFIIPIQRQSANSHLRPILAWETAVHNIKWGVLMVNGGGFAIAEASDKSGFSFWFAKQLQGLASLEPWVIALSITAIAAFFTEVCSNTAASALFCPLLAELAIELKIEPIYLMMPAITACSFAFMLPSASPTLALGYGTGRLKVSEMIKSGFMCNIIGIGVINLVLNTWGVYYFDIKL